MLIYAYGILGAMPLLFVLGLFLGTYHVKQMAVHGGEEKYPRRVQKKVERYRELNPHYVESRRQVETND